MSNIILVLFVAIGLVACGPNKLTETSDKIVEIDVEFESFVTQFLVAGKINKRDITIDDLVMRFDLYDSELKETVLGQCTLGGKNPTIVIKRAYWLKASYFDKRELVFHELGHCILRLDHNETILTVSNQGVKFPTSLMYPYHLGPYRYGYDAAWLSYYDTQLFTMPASSRLSQYGSETDQDNLTIFN